MILGLVLFVSVIEVKQTFILCDLEFSIGVIRKLVLSVKILTRKVLKEVCHETKR